MSKFEFLGLNKPFFTIDPVPNFTTLPITIQIP